MSRRLASTLALSTTLVQLVERLAADEPPKEKTPAAPVAAQLEAASIIGPIGRPSRSSNEQHFFMISLAVPKLL